MIKYILISLSLVLFFVSAPVGAKACDCNMLPLKNLVKTSEHILVVKVISVEKENEPEYAGYRAKVKVLEVLKGNVLPSQDLFFDSADNSNCTFRFSNEGEYLIFAYKKGEKFYVYRCSYSELLARSEKTIKQVKKKM